MKKYLYKHKGLLIINIILMFVLTLTDIILALGLKEIVDSGVNKNIDRFKEILFYAIIFVILSFLLDYIVDVMKAKYINKTFLDLKEDLFSKLIQKDIMSFRKQNISHYISMFTNDITMLEQDYFNTILDFIYQSFRLITATVTIVVINPYLLVTVIIVGGLPILIPNLFGKKVSQYKKEFSDSLSNFTTSMKEFLSGYEVIKSFNIENKIKEEYANFNSEVERTKYRFKVISSFVTALSSVSGFLMFLAVIVVGTYMVIKGLMTVGYLIASVQLMNYIVSPLGNLAEDINKIKSIKKINEKFMELLFSNVSDKEGIEKVVFNDKIEFKNVSFSYKEGRDVLKDVNFSISKGEKCAIVGSSGSGKTTILKLLLGYFDDFDGEITIDGIDIRKIKADSLYQLISVIQQEVFMFDSSIKENIVLFNDYSDNYLNEIIEKSGLKPLINSLDNGLNTYVGESGCNLSGGERQRIAIARALVKNTPILILDEATSSLDNETAFKIENSLIDIKELTILVVTHKLIGNILEKYDKIIVIKDGRIKEIGTFQELIDKKGYFYSLYTIEGGLIDGSESILAAE
ncbi:ABC transporter ATP-binding protein [Caloranaerobacter azorensis]|uniref:ABC transporter ATP-binding protein n=1 Tax=Caloranaerobacter azorensis TaxID=116090 RepID=A0A6P1YDU9_9FIRM|nr:ABC transporter ATP-binding protein [Caloranaerobacter azorensis]QIB27401.1 ABC transporter ATP-binding protein [Caloranaerobacter azorensis]